MIQLTRLNNKLLVLNADLVQFIEQAPDTVITLITGEKVLVKEPLEHVVEQIVAFRRCVLTGLCAVSPCSVAFRKINEHRDPAALDD
ncbi:MAG: flagellar FlbD family protein [Terriglobia bacterium]